MSRVLKLDDGTTCTVTEEIYFANQPGSYPRELWHDHGFEDTSWSNDEMGSLRRGHVRVWVDSLDPQEREPRWSDRLRRVCVDPPRFVVAVECPDGCCCDEIGEADTLEALLVLTDAADERGPYACELEPLCDACDALVIQGVVCHEQGCPNKGAADWGV